MNHFYAQLEQRIGKFKVYNVNTMSDEFMVVSGMPARIGEPNHTFPTKRSPSIIRHNNICLVICLSLAR